jgi:hypothetical protein
MEESTLELDSQKEGKEDRTGISRDRTSDLAQQQTSSPFFGWPSCLLSYSYNGGQTLELIERQSKYFKISKRKLKLGCFGRRKNFS